MRFRETRFKRPVNLDSIALTDIVMNLFLFFFITFNLFATFKTGRESPLKVILPSITKGTAQAKIPIHEIRLTKTGELLWDEKKLTLEELKVKLENQESKQKPITLRADRDASVQTLVNVLEIVRNAGAANVSLQTQIKS